MRSEAVPGALRDTTDRAHAPAAVAVPRVWALEVEAVFVAAVVAGAGRPVHFGSEFMG